MSAREPVTYPPLVMPANVEREKITIWSQGVPLDGDIYRPKTIGAAEDLPAVVHCHGWGGDKHTAERYAASLAASGMITLCFTQSTWGESGGALIPVGDMPELDENNEATVKVRMVQDLVDPLDWVQNYRAAVDYIEGEPHVDTNRIGGWGTSYGGGIVVSAATHDDRIKALSVQVPMLFNPPESFMPVIKERAIQIARGQIDPIPQDTDSFPGMVGTPHYARMGQHRPGDLVARVKIPTLIIDAGNEEFFDITISGAAAHERLKNNGVDTYYEVIPGIDHYGIYLDGYERGNQLAHEWFGKYL
ncbi:MAG: acetylxylan esterase [Myxococcota bacterium]